MNKDNFILKKVKVKKGTVSVEYIEKYQDSDDNWRLNFYTLRKHIEPHPDLHAELALLKIHVATIFNYDPKKFDQENIVVQSVSHSGEGKKEGIVISSAMTVLNNRTVALNTPFITFTKDVYADGEKLAEIWEDIQSEVFDYIYNGKAAQLRLDLVEDAA